VPEAGLTADQRLAVAIEKNVLVQLEHLKTHPAVKAALEARTLRLHGWVYHFEKGQVEVYDPLSGRFVPLPEQVRPGMLTAAAKDEGPRTEWETHV
jgi:carbonic anhydrase